MIYQAHLASGRILDIEIDESGLAFAWSSAPEMNLFAQSGTVYLLGKGGEILNMDHVAALIPVVN